MLNKVVSPREAVSSIADEAVITVSSSSGLGCPDLVMKAIRERFEVEGHPQKITTLHPIAAGDMSGIDGIDHIAVSGLLGKVIAGSYPSGPSSKPMPKIWQMITNDEIPAYNIPSGVLFDMHRDVAARKAGVLTKIGLQTFVDPDLNGCAMNNMASHEPVVKKVEFDGEEWLHFQNIVPSVAIIRATTADEWGNLSFEHEGAYLGTLDQAIAVRNHGGVVIAQVKRLAAAGSLHPYDVHVPGHLVDRIVVDPNQKQTTETDYDPAISGEITRPLSSFTLPSHGVQKIMARRAALELRAGQSANLGFGISAMVPRIVLEEGEQEKVTWVIEQGAVGGVPLTGFAFGCASNADSIIPAPSQFTYFQGGGFDISFLSFLEIDSQGNVNVSKLGKKPYLTAGCGGFVDITAHAKKIVFLGYFAAGAEIELKANEIRITKQGRFTKFVDEVEQITFSGRRAKITGQDVLYITERCVLRCQADGLVATEIMPGIRPDIDIVEASEGRVRIAEDAKQSPSSLFSSGLIGLKL